MTWQPSSLTRGQMEERRLAGARLLRSQRFSQAEIAEQLGVSRAAVNQWAQQLEAGGLRQLRQHKAPGRPAKLSRKQQKRLLRLLKKGAQKAGFETNRWTLPRIQTLIVREFGVTYHEKYLNRLLRKLDWTPQVPLPRAQERDENLIAAWLQHDWTRIKKSAAARRRNRLL
jgi:transposase